MIKIDFKAASVFSSLERLSHRLDDLSPVHEEIGEYMIRATKQRFVEGRAPDGTPWAPKKPATIARYQERGDGHRPKPLIGPSGRLGREIAMLADREKVEIGSALEYSGVMQGGAGKGAFGTDRGGRPVPWGPIVPRVWLGLSETDEREIIDIADGELGGTIDG